MSSSADPSPILVAEELSVRRGSCDILQQVSVSIRTGEFVCVTGPNGAGKTTLLRCLLGLVQPSQGRVLMAGRPLDQFARREAAKMMGYVPQADGRTVSFTVEEFVLLGRYPYWTRFSTITAKDRSVVREALDLTGLSAFANRSMSSLSGGERQRAFIAATIAQDARVLLLDEPTAFLDPGYQIGICELLCWLNSVRGFTIIMVTHDINLAGHCGHRVLALQRGRVVYKGPAAGFLATDVLETLYGVPFELINGATGCAWAVPRVSS